MDRRRLLHATGLALVGGAGCLGGGSLPGGGAEQSGSGAGVDHARAELETYRDHEEAIEDGYEKAGTCVDGLGVPFVKSDVPQVSYDVPNTLFYGRTETGDYDLLGAEWFVPASEADEPPKLFAGEDRRTFHEPMASHYPGQPRHYGLHGWLFTDNLEGRFANRNPDVTCPE